MRMRLRSGWRDSQAGFLVLIEILVVVVIIAGLAGYFLMGSGGGNSGGGGAGGVAGLAPGSGGGGGGGATTIPGKSLEMAKGTVCRNDLAQLRTAVAAYYSTTGSYPTDLASLNAGSALVCPVGGEAYTYDAATGQVSCPHRGHTMY